MATSSLQRTRTAEQLALPASYWEPLWYAAYTSANRERRVAEQLARRSVEHFLPLYTAMRRWKDRQVRLEIPLFPGYVFVRLALRDRLQVLQVPGVASLVGTCGTPAALPPGEIRALQTALASGARAEPYPYLTVGRRVTVKAGPLAGMKGIVLRRRSRLQVIVSIELIQRSVAVELDVADLQRN